MTTLQPTHRKRLPDKLPPSHPLSLQPEDIQRLLNEDTPDVRSDIIKRIAQAHAGRQYSLREIVIAEQIFRALIVDTEVQVREALAMALKDNPSIPRDIILMLAQDIDSVALPVIESSEVLTDDDLISLIQSAQQSQKPIAMARRKRVSEELSEAVIATQSHKAIQQLVLNPNATISEKKLHDIVREYGNNTSLMEALGSRHDLSITVVEKVISLVSRSLMETLQKKYNIAHSVISEESEKTRELATLKLADGKVQPAEIEKLVDQLFVFGRLNPSIILTSLCRGNLHFFEASLARLSNIPLRNAKILIHDKGGMGFNALYTKAGLPDKFFAASKHLLEVVTEIRGTNQRPTADVLAQQLIARTNGKNIENLSYILALIRQNG